MINTLKKLFGLGPKVDYALLVKHGAVILDVRSPGEYKQGHIKGSLNAPLNDLSRHISKIKKETTDAKRISKKHFKIEWFY